jgi:hypothetical protein
MPREIVRFVPNVPAEVALQFPTGKNVDGQFGPQTMFSLEGNKVMYLDPGPAKMVETLGPQVGEPFMIVKKSTGRRDERATWDVYLRIERAGSPLEAQLRDSVVHNEGRKAAQSAASPVPASGSGRGTGTYGPVAAPAPAVRQIPTKRQFADAFALFLVDAGRATIAAERALSSEGAVRFDSRDIAAIATSMFIAADKNGFLTWDGGAQ